MAKVLVVKELVPCMCLHMAWKKTWNKTKSPLQRLIQKWVILGCMATSSILFMVFCSRNSVFLCPGLMVLLLSLFPFFLCVSALQWVVWHNYAAILDFFKRDFEMIQVKLRLNKKKHSALCMLCTAIIPFLERIVSTSLFFFFWSVSPVFAKINVILPDSAMFFDWCTCLKDDLALSEFCYLMLLWKTHVKVLISTFLL